jgi:nucleotide-binding universal stress UspA family protein
MRRVHRRGAAAGEVITSYAEEEAVDLIVMGTHGRRGLRRLALGSVAEEVVREAPCAVMTVREETRPKPQAIDRMLVPVDFSDVTTTLAERATALAAAYDAAVDLVHVVEPMPSVTTMGEGWVGPELIPQLVDQAGKELERLAEAVGAEVPVATHVSQGPPASAILDTAADRESDLIAMASHGRTGLERVMLGSVTARVVRRAECPVVTLRAAKASAEEDEAS